MRNNVSVAFGALPKCLRRVYAGDGDLSFTAVCQLAGLHMNGSRTYFDDVDKEWPDAESVLFDLLWSVDNSWTTSWARAVYMLVYNDRRGVEHVQTWLYGTTLIEDVHTDVGRRLKQQYLCRRWSVDRHPDASWCVLLDAPTVDDAAHLRLLRHYVGAPTPIDDATLRPSERDWQPVLFTCALHSGRCVQQTFWRGTINTVQYGVADEQSDLTASSGSSES